RVNIVVISKKEDSFVGTSENKKYTILKDVTFKDGNWEGTISKPGSSSEADCELTLTDEGLEVVAHKGFISKTIVWTKVPE
ncbi:MAG TPA: hypothetical protein DIU20_11765, partial [Cryomorphaceae bacterium]|nr:hypothetical protein [Cryomorphaceae bacterium]